MDRALRCRRRHRRVSTRAAFAPRRSPVCGLCVPDWRERSLDQATHPTRERTIRKNTM